jgi:hypothetical protein
MPLVVLQLTALVTCIDLMTEKLKWSVLLYNLVELRGKDIVRSR